jgi:hypothetical protein
MPLGLLSRVRLLGWLPSRLRPGPQPPRGRRGSQRRGSHRRARGASVLTGSGPVFGPGEPGEPGAADCRPAASARTITRVAPPKPRSPGTAIPGGGPGAGPGSGPGRGQPALPRSQPGVAAGNARAAIRTMQAAKERIGPAQRRSAARQARTASRPWYEQQSVNRAAPGMRDCGCLESMLVREWEAEATPEPATLAAINRLAELPQLIKERLAAGLDAIYVGSGGVPDLDDMGDLKGVLLPSRRATWDACAGAYGDKKIIVGSRPSPTPDVMSHEIGHALDDLDGPEGQWQSDSAEFCRLYQRCMSLLASAFHRQGGPLGRREFFADSFAAIASGQRPALVEMLSGDTRAALDVMLYFNVRYGI